MGLKNMEVQTTTKQALDTTTKVLLSIGMISAFVVGISIAQALFSARLFQEPIEPRPIIEYGTPLKIMDVTNGAAAPEIDTATILYAVDNSFPNSFYGMINWQTYQDGQNFDTPKPIAIGNTTAVVDRVVSIETNIGTQTICIPDSNPSIAYFYIDVLGDSYPTSQLVKPSLTNCSLTKSLAFAPSQIISGQFNIQYDTDQQNISFKRDSTLLAYTTLGDTITVLNNEAMPGSLSPFLISVSGTDSNHTIPKRTITLETNLGTHTLCLPETQVSTISSTNYFYDSSGAPYSDALLTNQISCGSQSVAPTCTDDDPGSYPNSYGKVGVSGSASGVLSDGRDYTFSDWCAGNDIQLFEYYCYDNPDGDGSVPGQTGYNCQNGCVDGACIGEEIPNCLDSQPEANIYTRAFVQGIDTNGEFYRFEDECSGTGLQVNKYWCYENPDGEGQVNGNMVYDCPSGQCSNGACIEKELFKVE